MLYQVGGPAPVLSGFTMAGMPILSYNQVETREDWTMTRSSKSANNGTCINIFDASSVFRRMDASLVYRRIFSLGMYLMRG